MGSASEFFFFCSFFFFFCFTNIVFFFFAVLPHPAGYVQNWKSLTDVVVLGAGHLLPADQAVNSQAMIEDWVLEWGLFKNVLQENVSKESIFVEKPLRLDIS